MGIYISTYFETSFFLVALKACTYQTCTVSSLLPWKLLPGSAEPQQLRLSIATAQVGSFLDDDDGELASAQNEKNSAPTFWEIFQPQVVVFLVIVHLIWIKDQSIHMCFFWKYASVAVIAALFGLSHLMTIEAPQV